MKLMIKRGGEDHSHPQRSDYSSVPVSQLLNVNPVRQIKTTPLPFVVAICDNSEYTTEYLCEVDNLLGIHSSI